MAEDPPVVCHVTTVHRVPDPRIFLKECRSLAQAGYAVHVIFTGDDGGFEWGSITPHRIGPRRRNRFARVLFWPAVVRALLRIKPRLVHFHDAELLPLMSLLRLIWRRTVFLFDMHEDYAQVLKTYGWPYSALSAPYSALLSYAERRMAVVLAEESYQSLMRQPRPVIRNFVEASAVSPGPPRKDKSMVYVGMVSERRGASLMIEAFSALQSDDWTLQIVGHPDTATLLDELQALAERRSRFPAQIRVRDYMPLHEARKLIEQARVGLCLLSPEANSVGSLPTKVFDYLACGTLVLLSDFPFYRRFFEGVPGIYFVDPLDHDCVVDALGRLLKLAETGDFEQQSTAARAVCRARFTWESEALKLTTYYRGLLART